jgi:UDP-glucose:tetrahydrobiopterin glucosyltransferase
MQGFQPLKILFISTSVAPLGSGIGGGVELTICNLANVLMKRRYQIDVLAPEGSVMQNLNIIQITGNLQPKAQFQSRTGLPASPDNSVLSNMCDYARQHQANYDLILNFSYDWLPLYLTPTFETPLVHFISMSSLNDAIDFEIKRVASAFPNSLSCNTYSQASTFPVPDKFTILGKGIDLSKYNFCEKPDDYFIWAGRISREKGLEDAVEAACITSSMLTILGKNEDPEYWNNIKQNYPDTNLNYAGFLPTEKMQEILGKARAMLMTPHWVEAFGNVVIEAFACGVPVISYRIGGPAEIIEDGVTGFLTKPGNVYELAEKMQFINQIDRNACRQTALRNYSLDTWCERVEEWMHRSAHQDRFTVL